MLAKPMQVTSINTTAIAAPEPGPTTLLTRATAADLTVRVCETHLGAVACCIHGQRCLNLRRDQPVAEVLASVVGRKSTNRTMWENPSSPIEHQLSSGEKL